MSPRWVDVLIWLMGLAAGAGLAALIWYVPPNPWSIMVGLLLVGLTLMGLSAPLWRRLLRKMIHKGEDGEIVRMGLRFGFWTGLFVAVLIFLQIQQFMDRILVLAILTLFIMVEMFLQQHAARKRGRR